MIFETSTLKLAKISSKILDTQKKFFCRAVLSERRSVKDFRLLYF